MVKHKPHISRGFTIVELLVVVVIIGILATLTIVVYGNIKGRATDAKLKTDAENSAKQLALDQVVNSQYPATVDAANNGKGLAKGTGTSYQYTVNNGTNPPTYCLTITDQASTNGFYVTNTNNVPTVGLCPGDVQNPPSGTLPAIIFPMVGNQGVDYYLDMYGTVMQINSTATGVPTPNAQWQVMTKNTTTGTWSDVPGVGGTLITVSWDFGSTYSVGDFALFRVIYTNSVGSAISPTIRVAFSNGD